MKKQKKDKSAVSAPASSTVRSYVSYLSKKGNKSAVPVLEFSPLGIAKAEVRELTNAALAGNADAARALVLVADEAATELEAIWEGWAWTMSSRDLDFEKARDLHREMLRRIARERETWPILHHCRAARRKTTDQMLKQLELGTKTPLKAIGIADGHMRHLIETLSYEIGMPSADNAREWRDKAMDYVERNFHDQLYQERTWLQGLANPKRQVEKRRKKARAKLNEWEAKTRREHKSGELSPEESETKAAWLIRIRHNAKVTHAELRYGLKEALTAALKSLVQKRPQI